MIKILLLFLLILSPAWTYSQTIFGKWKTINEETGQPNSVIEIYKDGGEISGRVVKILKESDRDRICSNCQGELKDQPVEGLQLMKGLKKDGDQYSGGVITDPQTGKEYKVKIWLDEENPNLLKVRGYIAFFYRTEVWQRAK